MLCQTCSFKKSCGHLCKPVDSYLKSKRNYKTTHVNKEIGISEVSLKHGSFNAWMSSKKNRDRHQFHIQWMKIVKVIDTKLTDRQHEIIWVFLDGLPMREIGRRLGISGQAVNYTIFGHPKHGGGIVRKIQKLLT